MDERFAVQMVFWQLKQVYEAFTRCHLLTLNNMQLQPGDG